MASVYDRVKAVIVDRLKVDEEKITEEASLIDDLKLDSLDLADLVLKLEEEFSTDETQMEISDERAEAMKTVKDIVDYLKECGVQDEEEVTTG